MALDFDVCKVGKNATCTQVYIEDKTVYGADPDNRESYALYLVGHAYQEDGEDIVIEDIPNTDPLNVSTWDVPITVDGYYYFDLLPILIWKSDLLFYKGDICYENTFYWRCLVDDNAHQPGTVEGSHYWEKIDESELAGEIGKFNDPTPSDVIPTPTIDDISRFDTIILCKADICYSKVMVEAAKQDCDDCVEINNNAFVKVDVLLQSAYLLAAQTKYVEAHKVALLLSDVCNDLSDCGCS